MKAETEKIILADEAAKEKLVSARIQAQKLKDEARREAAKMAAARKQEMIPALDQDITQLISDAQAKALRIQEETNLYIEKIRSKEKQVFEALMQNLVNKVAGVLLGVKSS